MAKKRRGRKMPAWRKWAKAAVGILGKGIGIASAVSPAARPLMNLASNPPRVPSDLLWAYTGFNANDGSFNGKQALIGVGSVLGGILIMKLFGYLSKSV